MGSYGCPWGGSREAKVPPFLLLEDPHPFSRKHLPRQLHRKSEGVNCILEAEIVLGVLYRKGGTPFFLKWGAGARWVSGGK